eukprot:m.399730 g.399730  ORF g.399730 m.399730 type:complete len:64 (+) comp20113_c1_seq48:1250-1441(+)
MARTLYHGAGGLMMRSAGLRARFALTLCWSGCGGCNGTPALEVAGGSDVGPTNAQSSRHMPAG